MTRSECDICADEVPHIKDLYPIPEQYRTEGIVECCPACVLEVNISLAEFRKARKESEASAIRVAYSNLKLKYKGQCREEKDFEQKLMDKKPVAHIENWHEVISFGKVRLFGVVSGHPRLPDCDEMAQTSSIITIDRKKKIAETRNTIYTLGKEINGWKDEG